MTDWLPAWIPGWLSASGPVRYALFAFGGLCALILLSWLARREPAFRVRARPLMTPNEYEFLQRLEAAAPECRIMAQVSMGALLEPDIAPTPRAQAGARGPAGTRGRGGAGGRFLSIRGRFAQKVVDYVVLDADLNVVALVELDDRTHDARKDAERDAMTAMAGYPTLRYESRDKPEPQAIRADLLSLSRPRRTRAAPARATP